MLSDKEKILVEKAKAYANAEILRKEAFTTYLICKRKNLLKHAFTAIPKQTTVQKERIEKIKKELEPDANLRDAIDDLIVQYRAIPTKADRIRKVTVNSVIKNLETLLKEY